MKKIVLLISALCCTPASSQVSMTPVATHYNSPYQVVLSGNGTLYYTTDGSTPTLNSPSAVNSVQITIDTNKEVRAFVVNSGAASQVFSKKYYTGALPTTAIYFKMPQGWASGSCAMIDMVNPNAINGSAIDSQWPGSSMTATGCENWYRITRSFNDGTVRFNNCSPFENIPQTLSIGTIPVHEVLCYDFTNGPISNPPSCLYLGTGEKETQPVMVVKVYPNPVSELLILNSDRVFKAYEIVNQEGKVVSNNLLISKEISVSHLVPGNYFIKLKDQQNNTVLLKFIKK